MQIRNPFKDLLSVIHSEELIRLRVRASKKQDTVYLADILLNELQERQILAEHYSEKMIS